MAFKLNGWSAFTSKEERKIRKAKKKIRKVGKYGPEEELQIPFVPGEDLMAAGKPGKDFSKSQERKRDAAVDKLKKAGWSDERIEEVTGAKGWSKAMEWATKKDKK